MAAETTSSAAGPGRGGRMSRRRKRDVVLGLLRGEDPEAVSRALGVTAAALSGWRDAFLAAGEASLATRSAGGAELESERLKARLGEERVKQLVAEQLRTVKDRRGFARQEWPSCGRGTRRSTARCWRAPRPGCSAPIATASASGGGCARRL